MAKRTMPKSEKLNPSSIENGRTVFGVRVAGLHSEVAQSEAKFEAQEEARLERQSLGFYTMIEAAQALADANGLDAVAILARMEAAYRAGELTVRAVSTQAPHAVGATLRTFHDWVFLGDLDAMLERWRVTYRFPRAPVQAEASGPATPTTMNFETAENRQARVLGWFEEEQAKKPRGALARVADRDGRTRQTVSKDIKRAQQAKKARVGALAAITRFVRG